jgi:pimeloyl-ACP methyl ester carboxylesterase
MTTWTLPQVDEFEGRAVRYRVCGNGPPMVMVHGTPWSSFNLRHFIKGFSDDHTVYYYDLLGYGQSDKAGSADAPPQRPRSR